MNLGQLKLLILASVVVGNLAKANCADTICQFNSNGQLKKLDIESCGVGVSNVTVYYEFKGSQMTLPIDDQNSPMILTGVWFDKNVTKLKFADGGGNEVFNLQMTGRTGRITSSVPGLEANNARIVCPLN